MKSTFYLPTGEEVATTITVQLANKTQKTKSESHLPGSGALMMM